MNPYPIQFYGKEIVNNGSLLCRLFYNFTTRKGRDYTIEFEKYKFNVYLIKFYLTGCGNHSDNLITYLNEGDAFRIFSTCISAIAGILHRNPDASFGFTMPPDKKQGHIHNRDFKIYQKLAMRCFSPNTYMHRRDKNNTMYILLNTKNSKLSPIKIERIFYK